MRSKRTVLVSASLAVTLLLVFSLGLRVQSTSQFAAGLEWAGTTSDKYSAFNFSLTNQTLSPSGIKHILFQWTEKDGGIGSCHAELYPLGTQHIGVLTAYIGVPVDAKKVRVLSCGPPGPVQQRIQGLVRRLPWSLQTRFPSRWVYQSEVYSPLLPWTTNPALQATAALPGS